MERWMTPDLNKVLMLLGIGMLSFSVLIGVMAKRIRKSFKPFSKRALLFGLVSLIPFALAGLLVATGLFSNYTSWYIFFQALFLLTGSLHLYYMERKLPWGQDQAFWADLLFTLLIMLAGGICFFMLYRLVNREGLELIMSTSVFFFILPLFVLYTWRTAMVIPPKVYKQWYYPVHQPIEDPDENKLKNMLLISFEFQKGGTDHYFTNFRAKAPADMELRLLFYYFINDYNERHPQGTIHYLNDVGEPCGWMFYKKPKWYNVFTQYMDADKTIFTNRIRENDVIVCARTYN
jgi:hypothetical protein